MKVQFGTAFVTTQPVQGDQWHSFFNHFVAAGRDSGIRTYAQNGQRAIVLVADSAHKDSFVKNKLNELGIKADQLDVGVNF